MFYYSFIFFDMQDFFMDYYRNFFLVFILAMIVHPYDQEL